MLHAGTLIEVACNRILIFGPDYPAINDQWSSFRWSLKDIQYLQTTFEVEME